jgi:hypothetical protein
MANLNYDNAITVNLSNAVLVAGSTSTVSSTNTTNAVIAGKFGTTLGAMTNAASPTIDAATGKAFNALTPNQCCSIVFGVTAAGALAMCQGEIIGTNAGITTTVGTLLNDPQFPGIPDNFCPLAYTVVRTAPSAANWTPGSSSWAASGVSASTFANVAQLPSRPQAS